MSRGRKIGVVLLAVLIAPVLFAVYESRFAWHHLDTTRGFSGESISLVNLIATPENYDGKWIRVEGVCAFEFEGNALYLSRDDMKHHVFKNAVWADYETLGADRWDLAFMFKFHRRHVLVEGYFSSHAHGHFGMYSGAITNMNRIMTE